MGRIHQRWNTEVKKHFISDETARFAALCMVWATLNAMGFTILFHEPPSTMRDIIIALMGGLTTIFVQQVQYYNKTGVSNDRAKDEVIHSQAKVIQSQTAAANPDVNSIGIKDGEKVTVVSENAKVDEV